MYRNCNAPRGIMKSATFPSIRVEPELRDAAESILGEGETLSGFVEQAIREGIERRRNQSEFIARGLASRDAAQRSGDYLPASEVLEKLERRLDALRDARRKPR
jgi:predicted transcriptional regulator